MDQALHCIRTGLCDSAIVGGSNLCLKPAVAAQFMKLGMLSPDGMCKSFDIEGKLKEIFWPLKKKLSDKVTHTPNVEW